MSSDFASAEDSWEAQKPGTQWKHWGQQRLPACPWTGRMAGRRSVHNTGSTDCPSSPYSRSFLRHRLPAPEKLGETIII